MTIGDVFAVVAGFAGLFLTSWAMTVASGLLFPVHVQKAADALETRSRRTLAIGAAWTLGFGFLGVVLLNGATPGAKLVGWVLLLALLAMGSLGLAGMSRIVAVRIQEMVGGMAFYPAYIRAAAYLIGGAMLPVLGWFLFGPVLLMAAIGAGFRSMAKPPRATEIAEAV